jgi:uncharacterized membrane protein YGL010W
MDNLLLHRLWGVLPWSILALVALGVAVFYVVLDTSHGATGMSWIILRWFHSLCWLFLALAALARAQITPLPTAWAVPLAAAGGVTYAIFLVTGIVTGTVFR